MTQLDFRKLAALAVGLAIAAVPSQGVAIPFLTNESSEFLIIGTGPANGANTVDVGNASNTNNFELGANKAPVPSTPTSSRGVAVAAGRAWRATFPTSTTS